MNTPMSSINRITSYNVCYTKLLRYFSKKRPSQIREISDMAPTMTRIRDANEFMVAVSVKERIAACLSVFIKKAIPSGGIGRSAGTTVNGKLDYEGKTITPGMIKELNAGDDRITSYNVCYTKLLRGCCIRRDGLSRSRQAAARNRDSALLFPSIDRLLHVPHTPAGNR